MKELYRWSEGLKKKNKRTEDSDGGADPKIKDLGRERRAKKSLELTDKELLRKLRAAEDNIRLVQKDSEYNYEP